MSPLQPFSIAGPDAGLQSDRKPYLIPDKAFPVLENAYCWRSRVKKRECIKKVGATGRLRRVLVAVAAGNTTYIAGSYVNGINLFTQLGLLATEPNASVELGSLTTITVTIGAQTLTNANSTGVMTVTAGNITAAYINYSTGILIFSASAPSGGLVAVTVSMAYYPGLPVMGIESRELSSINNEQSLFFDTKYVYNFSANNFNSIDPYTWDGGDDDFFWSTNYQGADSSIRTFFVTNFVDSAGSPMRYTQDGTTFTDFAPQLDAAGTLLLEARCLIPYYGRLLAFNTIEGLAYGAAAPNFFNRVRFSQQGNPLQADAWRSDIFGKGGFADAPTSEQIVSVVFFKNTLIVFFERSTWQLRYVGEYGPPFLFERISSDFGSESTFSPTLFDSGVLAVGDRAIIQSNAVTVSRIDEAVPDLVFEIKNTQDGPQRVQGIRDFQKELVYWCFNDSDISTTDQYFPNKVIVYNYRNNTYALFRDNVTVFGTLQPTEGITWDSTDITWDDADVTWDTVSNYALFPRIVIGNQAGFIHYYGYNTPDDPYISIKSIDLTTTPIQLVVPNHNLDNDESIYITGLTFLNAGSPISTDLNNQIYLAKYIDNNTLGLYKWDFTQQIYVNNFSFTPSSSASYVGGGLITLLPKLNVQTKDFNPYTPAGKQIKMSYIDFLMDTTNSSAMSVNLYTNTFLALAGNIKIGNSSLETYLTAPYYGNDAINSSDIAWHRFFCTIIGQFIRIQMTYDDNLMNTLATHQQTWVLNAINFYARQGGKLIF